MEGKDLSGISERDFLSRQQVIDVDKWLASERAGHDLCGTMDYCGYCVKAEMHPCAKAEFRYKMRVALDELEEEENAREETAAADAVAPVNADEKAAAAEEDREKETAPQAPVKGGAEAEEEAVSPAAEERAEETPTEGTFAAIAEEDAEEAAAALLAEGEERRADEEELLSELAATENEPFAEQESERDERSFAEEDKTEGRSFDEEDKTEQGAPAAEKSANAAPSQKTSPEEGEEGGQTAVVPDGYEEVIRYRRSFKSRLIQNEKAQDHYTELKNALSELSGIRSRLCQGCENFRVGKSRIAKINIGGKTLVLYLALDPREYEETKYRFTDVSEKKTYAETPMKLRITSARALRHAKELIADLAEKFSLANVGCIYMDYHFPYRTDEQLIAKGLIKPYKALVKKKNK